MAKYHLKEDGTPAFCSAELRACPRGGAESHYSSPEEASAAYEASMASSVVAPPVRKSRRSLMDRLTGRSESEAAWRRLDKEYYSMGSWKNLDGLSRSIDLNTVEELAKAALHYRHREEEALELLEHAKALMVKLDAGSRAARQIIGEHPRAFRSGILQTHGYVAEVGRSSGKVTGGAILEPGEDRVVHQQLMPMVANLVRERTQLQSSLHSLLEEAETLSAVIKKEGNLSTEGRVVLSERAQELYAQAMSTENMPSPEVVEDRRAWTQARTEAYRELTEKGLL